MSTPVTRDRLRFAVNGAVHEVAGDDAFLPLSTWLRERLRATGTKIVCSEGDCGACTVLVGTPVGERFDYRAIDACIAPLGQLDGRHVVSVDALAPRSVEARELHPVQRAMAEQFGSQCGYCTPGFVMALVAVTEQERVRGARLSDPELRTALSGNLCRCTGYVQIVDAARAVDPGSTPPLAALFDERALLAELGAARAESVRVESGVRSIAIPADWREALALRAAEPAATVIAGATDVGVRINKGVLTPERVLLLRPELVEASICDIENNTLRIGAGVRWTEILDFSRHHAPELAEILERFGAPQIRNAGTIGGNLVNASPIADSIPFLVASGATLIVESLRGERWIAIDDFYLGYKQIALASDELLREIVVPLPGEREAIRLAKLSRRRDLDISTVTAALWLRRSADGGSIEAARVALGGVAATVVRARGAEEILIGAPFARDLFERAGQRAAAEIAPLSDVRGSEASRRLAVENLLLRFFFELADGGAS